MTNRQVVLAKIFRFILAVGLLLVVTVIVWHLASRGRSRSVEPVKVETIPEGKVERQEGVEHFDFKDERVIQVKAARHYAGKDDRYYLEGDVEVKEINRKSGQEKFIRGDKISYDRNWNEVVLEGQGSIQGEGLKVESSFLRYQKDPGVIWTESGADFSSGKISGQAKRLRYAVTDRTLWLEGDVQLELKNEARSEETLIIRAATFGYGRLEGKGQAQGDVVFTFGPNHGQADSLLFEVTADEEHLEKIELRGNARVFLVRNKATQTKEENIPLMVASEREIEAATIVLMAFPGTAELQSLEAAGDCSLKSVASEGAFTFIRSQSMAVFFDLQGRMKEFLASGGASLEEKAKDGVLERLLTGRDILVERQGSKLTVRAGPDEEARMDSPDSEVLARTITLFPRQEVLEAVEEVRVVLKAQPEKEESVGFFGRQKHIFITGRRVRFERAENRFIFKEKIRLWQDKDMIMAEELTVLKETGEMSGEGRVQAVFFLPPRKEKKEERIEMGGGRMNFEPQANLLTFEREGWVKTPNVSLEGQSLVVSLAEKATEILTIGAKGKVAVRDALREGQGQEAFYDLEKETMVLTGNPVVRDKNRGIVQGEKLTFNLGDDRILVENKERERSTTVIKREQ